MKFLLKNTGCWMVKNFDLISIILGTCLTWLSRVEYSRSVNVIVRDPVLPERIFSQSQFINDYTNGSLSAALNKFSKNVVLLYLYSHWDAESLAHRTDIISVAEMLQDKIPVISLNCWDNNSECFTILKPTRFPQLLAYVSNQFLVEYKKSFDPVEIYDFVTKLFFPFNFPASQKELENIIKSSSMTFVVCLHNESPSFSRQIDSFHKAASILLGESNIRPDIAFVLVIANDLVFTRFRQTFDLNVNEGVLIDSLGFQRKFSNSFKSDNILDFLKSNTVVPIVKRYFANGIKSLHLQELLRSGITVFYVFDEKHQFLWESVKNRISFHTNAIQTYNCLRKMNRNESAVYDVLSYRSTMLKQHYTTFYDVRIKCNFYFNSKMYSKFSNNIQAFLDYQNSLNVKMKTDFHSDPFVVYSDFLSLDHVCRKHKLMTNNFFLDSNDYDSSLDRPMSSSMQFIELLNNKSCLNINRSISFVELDSGKYPQFLSNWGISPIHENGPSHVVVVDWQNYLIHNVVNINEHSFNDLIRQISLNNLTNHRKTISYGKCTEHICPINVQQLENELSNAETDLVVFYYTPWCSYCSSIINLIHMLSRYFRNNPSIHFRSLDTFNNDLPLKYQSERVPALIMFPRGRKSDSFTYPITESDISLNGMIRFILDNSGDRHLNLNGRSMGQRSEKSIVCDKSCLESSRETISRLIQKFVESYSSVVAELSFVRGKVLHNFCSFDHFHFEWLRFSKSKDWFDWGAKQYYIKIQSRTTLRLSRLYQKRRILQDKLSKLTKLHKGVDYISQHSLFGKSVKLMAADILKFSF